jgi:hypothetical protein
MLVSNLGKILEALNLSDLGLEKRTGINREHIAQVRDGNFKTISYRELHVFMGLANQAGMELFTLRHHPIWNSFKGTSVKLIREGGQSIWASKVESQLAVFFLSEAQNLACRAEPIIGLHNTPEVLNLMKTHNCIFTGSVKYNKATEIALAALWDMQAFVSTNENLKKAPLAFAFPEWSEGRGESAFVEPLTTSQRPGLYINNVSGSAKKRHFLELTYISPPEYRMWSGLGWDGGLLVVCRRPLQTKADVTTIIIAGYTGIATSEMAREVTQESINIGAKELEAERPIVRYFRFRFRKTAGDDQPDRIMKGRQWFYPTERGLKTLNSTSE